MKLFLDTNIIIDLIADRKPFSKYAIEIFKNAEEKILRDLLNNLLDYLKVIPVDVDILKKVLRSKNKDFEDANQIFCASTVEKMDCIVTRNVKYFRDCEILVLTPDELCIKL